MITRKELEHLSIFVNTMAATLYKAKQDEELENSYLNTIKALVKAIEEKDRITSYNVCYTKLLRKPSV